jgi:hypothetical protein
MTNRDARERLAHYADYLEKNAKLVSKAPGEDVLRMPGGSTVGGLAAKIVFGMIEVGSAILPDLRALLSDQPLPSVATGHPEQGAPLSGWLDEIELILRDTMTVQTGTEDWVTVRSVAGIDEAAGYVLALLSDQIQQVSALVVAAREVMDSDGGGDEIRAMDAALEPFAALVPYGENGDPPVTAGTTVTIRFRDGSEMTDVVRAGAQWSSGEAGYEDAADVVAYRIVTDNG